MTERIVQSSCRDSQLDQLTNALLRDAFENINTKGKFFLALSESVELDNFYTQLMCDPGMRGMPWQKMHVWFFGETNEEHSAQIAISTHSGILEDHVYTLSAQTVQEMDCCICTSNKEDLPNELFGKCRSWLLLEPECQTQTLDSETLGGVVHRYVCNETLD